MIVFISRQNQNQKQVKGYIDKYAITTYGSKDIPVQDLPSPLNPDPQLHLYDPIVFEQLAHGWHVWVPLVHSLISAVKG